MGDVKWIKLATDIFDDDKMVLIESLPNGAEITLIWIKLLTLAGKQFHNGVFVLDNGTFYTDEMFSTLFRVQLMTMKLALSTFERFGMIEYTQSGAVVIMNWAKYQTIEYAEKRREYQKNYMREYREKQKMLKENQLCETDVNVYESLPNFTVNNCKKITKENSEKSWDQKDVDIKEMAGISQSCKPNSKPYVNSREEERERDIYILCAERVVEFLNSKLGTAYRSDTKQTVKDIKAILKAKYTEDDIRDVIEFKVQQWRGTDNSKYLRPATLFRFTNFEVYLEDSKNQKWKKPPPMAERVIKTVYKDRDG